MSSPRLRKEVDEITYLEGAIPQQFFQCVYAFEIHKRGVRDGALPAPSHIQRVDALEIHKRGVNDGAQAASNRIQRGDALEIRKCGP